jgi:hypothetical protein
LCPLKPGNLVERLDVLAATMSKFPSVKTILGWIVLALRHLLCRSREEKYSIHKLLLRSAPAGYANLASLVSFACVAVSGTFTQQTGRTLYNILGIGLVNVGLDLLAGRAVLLCQGRKIRGDLEQPQVKDLFQLEESFPINMEVGSPALWLC